MNKNFLMLAVSVAVLSFSTVTAKADEEILDTPTRDYTLQDLNTRVPNVSTTSNRTNFSGNSFSNYLAGLGNSALSGAGLSRSGSGARGGPTLSEYKEFAESKIQETVGSRGGNGLGGLSDFLNNPRAALEKWARDKADAELKKISSQVGAKINQATGEIRNAAGQVVGKINQATGQISNAAGEIIGKMDTSGQIRSATGQVVGAVNSANGEIRSAVSQIGNTNNASGNGTVATGTTGNTEGVAGQTNGTATNPFVNNKTLVPQVLPGVSDDGYQTVSTGGTKGAGSDIAQTVPTLAGSDAVSGSYDTATASSRFDAGSSNPFSAAMR